MLTIKILNWEDYVCSGKTNEKKRDLISEARNNLIQQIDELDTSERWKTNAKTLVMSQQDILDVVANPALEGLDFEPIWALIAEAMEIDEDAGASVIDRADSLYEDLSIAFHAHDIEMYQSQEQIDDGTRYYDAITYEIQPGSMSSMEIESTLMEISKKYGEFLFAIEEVSAGDHYSDDWEDDDAGGVYMQGGDYTKPNLAKLAYKT